MNSLENSLNSCSFHALLRFNNPPPDYFLMSREDFEKIKRVQTQKITQQLMNDFDWHSVIGVSGGLRAVNPTLVYRAVNAVGDTIYVGITRNFMRRAAAQLSQKGIKIRAIPGLQILSNAEARAIEQVLIETYGIGSKGGSLINKINSISPNNPIYSDSVQRGLEWLNKVQYPGF